MVHDSGAPVAQFLGAIDIYPNEQALIDLVATGRVERRRALAYSTHACTMEITERIDDIITDTLPACR